MLGMGVALLVLLTGVGVLFRILILQYELSGFFLKKAMEYTWQGKILDLAFSMFNRSKIEPNI